MENKEKEIDLIELLRAVWAQKRKLCKWGVIGLVVGIVVAVSIPKEYKTVVQIAPEGTVQAGQGQMSGIAAMMGVNFCDEAWKAIYQYVFALAHGSGGELFYYGDWIRKPGVAICSCNDGLRPVIFKLEATTEESVIDYTPIR